MHCPCPTKIGEDWGLGAGDRSSMGSVECLLETLDSKLRYCRQKDFNERCLADPWLTGDEHELTLAAQGFG